MKQSVARVGHLDKWHLELLQRPVNKRVIAEAPERRSFGAHIRHPRRTRLWDHRNPSLAVRARGHVSVAPRTEDQLLVGVPQRDHAGVVQLAADAVAVEPARLVEDGDALVLYDSLARLYESQAVRAPARP